MLRIFKFQSRPASGRKIISRWTGLAVIIQIFSLAATAQNPFIRSMYTADPSAHVWSDGRLYVYPSHDIAPPRGCDLMDKYHVFSTDDMVHWTDHGEIVCADSVPWGRAEGGFMWAPDCAFKDSLYYFYFPHPSGTEWNSTWKIGVATSKYPAKDFKVQGYIEGLESLIDPCVFVDDDGQAYLYYGGGNVCKGGKLKSNMVEIDGSMQNMTGLSDFHEASWVHKRNGVYYLSYSDNNSTGGNRLRYAISTNPLGPWTYKGVYMDPTGSATDHGSIVEYKGQWYAFYHNSSLSGGNDWIRSICVDSLFYNEDGTIQKVKQTKGHGTPYSGTPYSIPGTIEAENYDLGGVAWAYADNDGRNNGQQYRLSEGVDIEKSSLGGYNVGWINKNEWIEYTVNVEQTGLYDFGVVVGSLNGSKINLKIDGVSATGTMIVPATGDWQKYDTVWKEDVTLTAGKHYLMAYMEESNFNFDKIIVKSLISGTPEIHADNFSKIYPNPASDIINIEYQSETSSQIAIDMLDYQGRLLKSQKEVSSAGLNHSIFDISNIDAGNYLLRIKSKSGTETIQLSIR